MGSSVSSCRGVIKDCSLGQGRGRRGRGEGEGERKEGRGSVVSANRAWSVEMSVPCTSGHSSSRAII